MKDSTLGELMTLQKLFLGFIIAVYDILFLIVLNAVIYADSQFKSSGV